MTNNKPQIETQSVKHVFTPEEIAGLNCDFRRAYEDLKVVNSEFDNVKASYKAKITERESRMETLSATLNAGFELRNKRCRVVMFPKERKKRFYLEDAPTDDVCVLTEDMTPADFQADLILAESKFDHREEIQIFQAAGDDHGIIAIGELGGHWFAALRIKIGKQLIEERLDSEQQSTKARFDAVQAAGKRASEWMHEALGKEVAKGFAASLAEAIEKQKERVE